MIFIIPNQLKCWIILYIYYNISIIFQKGFFKRGTLLSYIILSSSVTIIKELVFKGCPFLKSITLPEKFGIIGKCALEICYNLEKVIFVECMFENYHFCILN